MTFLWTSAKALADFLCYSMIRNVILEKLIPADASGNIKFIVDEGAVIVVRQDDDDAEPICLFAVFHNTDDPDNVHVDMPALGDNIRFLIHVYPDGYSIRPSAETKEIEDPEVKKAVNYAEMCLQDELHAIGNHFEIASAQEEPYEDTDNVDEED